MKLELMRSISEMRCKAEWKINPAESIRKTIDQH